MYTKINVNNYLMILLKYSVWFVIPLLYSILVPLSTIHCYLYKSYLGQYFLFPTICSADLNANAEMVNDGLTPRGLGIMEPSITYRSA